MVDKPYLLLDVDGPINPFRLITKKGHLTPKTRTGEDPYDYDKHLMRPPDWADKDDLPVLLSKDMGSDLNDLRDTFDIVWATTWENRANEMLSPVLGLPEDLPVISWDLAHPSFRNRSVTDCWKTPLIVDWLADRGPRPWVFIDDEVRRNDRTYVNLHMPGSHQEPWKLIEIHPLHGLRRGDMTMLRDWARVNS